MKYIETSVINRYYNLCKKYLSEPANEDIENCVQTLSAESAYDHTLMDVASYISSLPEGSGKRQILSLYLYEDMSDAAIAAQLHLSRQYVNRIKKQLCKEYFCLHS